MNPAEPPEPRRRPPNPEADASFRAVLARAQAGDRGALDELFARFYDQVAAMVHASLASDIQLNRGWLSARFSTGDIVQEVFRSVLDDVSRFLGVTERAFAGYLALVVRNRIIDAIRFHEAERRDGRLSGGEVQEWDAAVTMTPPDIVSQQEEAERYIALLAELPEREQLLLRARFEGVATFAELAEQLGYGSVSTARRAFDAARTALAMRLSRDTQGGLR